MLPWLGWYMQVHLGPTPENLRFRLIDSIRLLRPDARCMMQQHSKATDWRNSRSVRIPKIRLLVLLLLLLLLFLHERYPRIPFWDLILP